MKKNQFLLLSLLLFSSIIPFFQLRTSALPNPDIVLTDTPLEPNQDTSGLVKVLNYNIEYAGADPNWKTVIQREDADIILLVETGDTYRPGEGGTFELLLNELSSYFPAKTPYQGVTFDTNSNTDGQAVLSRFPIVDFNIATTFKLDDGSTHRINHPIVDATLDIHGMQVHFLVNHLTCCGGGGPARLTEQEGIINYIDSLGDVPVIYGGDFNAHSPQDTGDLAPFQETLGTEPIEMLVDSTHPKSSQVHTFVDTYRELNPQLPGYTLNNIQEYESIDHYRGRIDYIFANQHLKPLMVNSSVVKDYQEAMTSSDHKPMYTYFNFLNEQQDLTPPLAVKNLEIQQMGDGFHLEWDANPEDDLMKYGLYRNQCRITDLYGNETSFEDTYKILPNSLYKYEIRATDIHNNQGRPSLPGYINSSLGVITAPQPPTLTAVSQPEGIEISWQVNDGGLPVLYSKHYRKTTLEGEWKIGGKTTATSAFVPVAVPNVNIYFIVVAVNDIGESKKSSIVNASSSAVSVNQWHQDTSRLHPSSFSESFPQECPAPLTTIIEALPTSQTTSSTKSSSSENGTANLLILSSFLLVAISYVSVRKLRS